MEVVTSASGNEGARSYTCDYNFGDTLEDCIDLFGDKVVYEAFVAQAKIALQGRIRAALKAEKSDDEINGIVDEWKPGERAPRKSKAEKFKDMFAALSPEEKAALLGDLTG